MTTPILIVIVLLLAAVLGISFVLLQRSRSNAAADLLPFLASIDKGLERLERSLHEQHSRIREEMAQESRSAREEQLASLTRFGDSLSKRVTEIATLQKGQLDIFSEQLRSLTDHTVRRLDRINETVDEKLRHLQEDTGKKLELMRLTVDEKLHDTLEKRLGESFQLVSQRLEQVHKGLGEMQSLAVGVGDLKKVLTNVKSRGTFGEIQLSSLLADILSPDQYEANVETKRGSNLRVEFAIRLPGRDDDNGRPVFLPIDAKFPQEDYQRLLDAQESGDAAAADEAARQLERSVREMGRAIHDKYLDPPHTTDFGVMFLPTEGLYAEVLRRSGLFEQLQREYKVVVSGPTTLAAFLNSLHMGFRTLAIEKRSSEVWTLLGAVKTEFSSFGSMLDKAKKKLQEASNTMDSASTRSRAIERKLRQVQSLSPPDAASLLMDLSPAEAEQEE
jgi:DNA recombination protein RmuC